LHFQLDGRKVFEKSPDYSEKNVEDLSDGRWKSKTLTSFP